MNKSVNHAGSKAIGPVDKNLCQAVTFSVPLKYL